jgi:pimeloyl-ACP methyl ester carboxylesterase
MVDFLAPDGVGAGIAVLMMHGRPGDRSIRRPQLVTFVVTHRVAAPDMRDYGGDRRADDACTPVVDARYMRDRIRGSQMCVLDGAGRLLTIKLLDAFNAVLAAFLDTCTA